MTQSNVMEELKELNVSIGQKMFILSKQEEVKNPPSPLQFQILNYLMNHKDSDVCQRDLEVNLHVNKSTISEVLLTMEKNELIKRVSSSNDARSKNIELTDMSLQRFDEMNRLVSKMNETLMKNIKKEDLSTFLSVIEIMKENMEEI